MPQAETISRIDSMRIGFTGSFYPVPANVEEDDIAEWQLQRAIELGCAVLQVSTLPKDHMKLAEFGQLAQSKSIELELSAPGAFSLAGPFSDERGANRFRQAIAYAKQLKMPVVRTAYGRLDVETSRFNQSFSIREHIEALVPALQAAAKIAEDAGVRLAVENHCDFTGRELAQLLDAVDSAYVGAALDTGNGYTVFSDPNEDIEALAAYTFTTHIKDMKVVKSQAKGWIPLTAFGCVLGEGHVDIPKALSLLAQKSPRADGLHLIVEPGWMIFDPTRDTASQSEEYFRKSIYYLQSLQQNRGRAKI
ncbi:sugar phosphate isomerase/epimerase family protein [Paenibacillus sp. PL91]|uniref:sugar phosphate isomerase/epimerase family protein n=1 Tax=Paenibacillus sp. PL91 TaxID=2729538 RepID=UPI00145C77ED|nr:sugar phosphate isomerase/epimerase family protein [Paenibacillus sp. PL91]MBC9200722.1 sugar phosphate isomerase/epimerase [Paenibacillus sp. PL91]